MSDETMAYFVDAIDEENQRLDNPSPKIADLVGRMRWRIAQERTSENDMTFTAALIALRAGRQIRRAKWDPLTVLCPFESIGRDAKFKLHRADGRIDHRWRPGPEELNARDWEVVQLPTGLTIDVQDKTSSVMMTLIPDHQDRGIHLFEGRNRVETDLLR